MTQAPTSRRPVRRVVIAGGGTAGWMVAACLSRTLGRLLDIRLVESDEIGTVGVGEATIPTLLTFHHLLGISEPEFMAATQATFKLGIRFEGWRDVGEDYIHSFGTTGTDHWTAAFQHFWLKGRERGLASDYGDYCLELRAAQEHRFAHLPRAGMNYAFHMDATLYGRYLRRLAEAHGVQRIEGRIAEVLTHEGEPGAAPTDRDLRALRLDNGAEIEGDLFIDCTGMRSLLLGQTLGVGYQDWSHWLPCDSAIAVQTASVREAVPYTRSIAHPWGWQWQIPLQHRVGNGVVFSSRYTDDDTARSTLLGNIDGEVLTAPRVIRFKPGQRDVVWKRNCVGVGLASGFLEPLESTSIHLIQRSAIRLMQMFPKDGIREPDIAEYNAQMADELEHIRDFIVLHYHVTNRADSPMWRDLRAMALPPSLRHRIDLFRETARVFRGQNELFTENSWVQVMLGQGLTPEQFHPTADLMGDAELAGFLGDQRARIEQTVRQLPPHQQYVMKYGPAMAPKAATAAA
ncbi:MAG: tryptophan 7-halogenase [Mitsuaria chitosanitabida]|uniref:tryptophan halogenase family protein n=1 Tax=Roseateles chitosanitabidus TaxID=65048 RepID=UPI001B27A00D|nr:tryptophan halogenase family protein [Roseateles chitosanitabidus]MBO9685956.1 tryptophan 7-halogenase [Roseateles chitosanitabidus]